MNRTARAHRVLRCIGLGIFKDFIAKDVVESITEHWYPKVRRRALSVGSLLGLLMAAHLDKGVESVEELLQRGWSRVRRRYGLRHVRLPVDRSAFSKRLKTLPWEIFEAVFDMALAAYAELVGPEQGRYRDLFTIQAIDGSVVNVAARLIRVWEGMPGRGGGRGSKAQARLHTMFNVGLRVPTMVIVGGAKGPERHKAKIMLQTALKQPYTIAVFDLGYFAFAFMAWIIRRQGFFVARLKEGTRHKILKRFGRRDWLVRVGGWTRAQASVVVRLVGVREGRRTYWYLTNLLPAHQITPTDVREIYRKRWMVELFFKGIKHVMRGQKFFCYNTNGIKVQVYAALTTYVMAKMVMALAAQTYQIPLDALSFQKTMTLMRLWINEHGASLWCLRPRREHLDELLYRVATFAHVTMHRQKITKRRKRAA